MRRYRDERRQHLSNVFVAHRSDDDGEATGVGFAQVRRERPRARRIVRAINKDAMPAPFAATASRSGRSVWTSASSSSNRAATTALAI